MFIFYKFMMLHNINKDIFRKKQEGKGDKRRSLSTVISNKIVQVNR